MYYENKFVIENLLNIHIDRRVLHNAKEVEEVQEMFKRGLRESLRN